MGEVIQMFTKKPTRILPSWAPGRSPLELRWDIVEQAHTVETYKSLITSMENPKDQFVARSFHKEEQLKLDKMTAEYTGLYGPLAV